SWAKLIEVNATLSCCGLGAGAVAALAGDGAGAGAGAAGGAAAGAAQAARIAVASASSAPRHPPRLTCSPRMPRTLPLPWRRRGPQARAGAPGGSAAMIARSTAPGALLRTPGWATKRLGRHDARDPVDQAADRIELLMHRG